MNQNPAIAATACNHRLLCLLLGMAPVLLFRPFAWAGEEKWTPPAVQAVYTDAAPVIDGQLDDACWSQASRLEGFFVPDTDQSVPEETIGLICVDDKAIYFGAICRDRTPEDIKATETRRNGDIWDDDWVELRLDPWHQHENTYSFNVTPNGTQYERIPGGSATKIEWRGDWTAAATRTPDGWTAEISVPFSILRYPPGQTVFGFAIKRGFAKERVEAVYPIMEGRLFNPNQAADLVGLRPPPPRPRPILMPYVILDLGEAVGGRFDTGLDVQYRMPSGLTALGTVNPDFKQIEDVVEPISFSYTERFLPDRRPFFVTGQSPYLPESYWLYTRRIEDFDAGVKLFGTVGNETLGLLNAIRYGDENSLAGHWGHKFGPDFNAGVGLVSHRKAGDPGDFLYGIDGSRSWRKPGGRDTLWWWFYQSETQGGPRGGYYQLMADYDRGSGQLAYGWTLMLVDPGFDAPLGFIFEQNTIGGGFSFSERDHYETGRLEDKHWSTNIVYLPFRDGSGVFESRLSHYRSWDFRSGKSVEIGIRRAREFSQDSSDVNARFRWNNRDMHRTGRLFVVKGVRAGGDYHYVSLSQGFRPTRHLSVNLGAEYTDLAPPAEDAGHQYQTVLTASYDLTPEKCISARLITRDAGTSGYAAYRQVVRRGMDVYVLVGDPDPSHTGFTRRVALKLIWVF